MIYAKMYVLNVIQVLEVMTPHGYKHGVRVFHGENTFYYMCDAK